MEASRSDPSSVLDLPVNDLYRFFFGVLSRLSDEGFILSPDGYLDLVHDFLHTEWEGIYRRLAPTYASPRPYVYTAFYFYARNQIGNRKHHASEFADTRVLADVATTGSSLGSALEAEEETEEFRAALRMLAQREKALLDGYLGHGLSERALADTEGLSRYETRDGLARALAGLTSRLGQRGILDTEEFKFGLALWRDGLKLADAAVAAGSNAASAKSLRNRLLKFYFVNYHRGLSGTEAAPLNATETNAMQKDSIERLKEIMFKGPFNEKALDEVRANADAFTAAVRAMQTPWTESEIEQFDHNPAWIARVMNALGSETAEQEQKQIHSILEAQEADESNVGIVFLDSLIPALSSEEMIDLGQWFEGTHTVSQPEFEYLLEKPCMKFNTKNIRALAWHGLTPLSIATASSGISSLIGRQARRGLLKTEPAVLLPGCAADQQDGQNAIAYAMAEMEIKKLTRTDISVASRLLAWMVTIAPAIQEFFRGYTASAPDSDSCLVELRALPTTSIERPFSKRWSKTPLYKPQLAKVCGSATTVSTLY